MQAASADGTLKNLFVNGIGLATFLGLFLWDRKQAEVRLEQRTNLRQAQIKFGDRYAIQGPGPVPGPCPNGSAIPS